MAAKNMIINKKFRFKNTVKAAAFNLATERQHPIQLRRAFLAIRCLYDIIAFLKIRKYFLIPW